MAGSRAGKAPNVFLNVPYDKEYERVLVGLTAALLAVGQVPRLTFQLPDGGEGRMSRIFELLRSCSVSFHDLSAVDLPPRFNMPFELGLACAIKEQSGDHKFVVLEKKAHRFDVHLSDLKGCDPKIHRGTSMGAIAAVLEVLERPGGNPTAAQVMRVFKTMMKSLPKLKEQHGNRPLFSRQVFSSLVQVGIGAAEQDGLLAHRAD